MLWIGIGSESKRNHFSIHSSQKPGKINLILSTELGAFPFCHQSDRCPVAVAVREEGTIEVNDINLCRVEETDLGFVVKMHLQIFRFLPKRESERSATNFCILADVLLLKPAQSSRKRCMLGCGTHTE